MRARISWLAPALLLVIAGCRTADDRAVPADSGAALPSADAHLAEALAHYSQALISESTLGEYRSGVLHYRRAGDSDPASLPLSLRAAADCIAQRDLAGATEVLTRAARYHPESADVQLLLGAVYHNGGQRSAAERAYRAAIRKGPQRADVYVRLASFYTVERKPRKALAVIDEGFTRVKTSAPLLELCETVGRICLAGKDYAAAILFFEKVRSHRPADDEVCEALGRCYVSVGRYHEAAAEFGALLKKDPGSSRYALLLGETYEQAGNFPGALEAFRRAMAGQPPNPAAPLLVAAMQMEKDPAGAVKTLEAAVVIFPDEIRLRVLLALIHMKAEHYVAATVQFDQADRILGQDATAAERLQPLFYYWYGMACERMGRHEDGERLMAKYLAANPGSTEALNALAYLWAEQGRNLDRAGAYITQALKANPENGSYLDTLGWIYYRKGEYGPAVYYLKKALKREGDEPTLLDHMGDAWEAFGQPDQAIRAWKRSLKMEPGNRSVREKLIKAGVDARTLPPPKDTP